MSDVRAKISELAVGLAANCDRPEGDVEKLMRANLPGASTLPFVGLVTYDGKWVTGYSGFKRAGDLLQVLQKAEQSPLLQASKAVRKKLAGLIPTAQKAAERGNWKSVLKATNAAAKTNGRCPERKTLQGLEKQARDWAAEKFATAIRIARTGGELVEARKALGEVRRQFSKEPEAEDAATGLKALTDLSRVVDREAKRGEPQTDLRTKYAEKYKDTRWPQIFKKASEE